MNQHDYLTDSQKLICMSGSHICEEMSYDQVIQAMTFFAFGIERLLKYLLCRVNPVFILKKSEFKNAVPCLYEDHLITKDKNKEITGEPDKEVISFRVALQRAILFSKSVYENRQLLYSIANYRDILAHRLTTEIDIKKANRLLSRESVRLISAFSSEISVPPVTFFGNECQRLINLSLEILEKENFEKRMNFMLSEHADYWEKKKKDASFIEHAKDITNFLLLTPVHEASYTEFPCPACSNKSVVRIEPDYDQDEESGMAYVTGEFIENLRCYFCELKLEDYEEINYFEIDSIFEHRDEMERVFNMHSKY
jgi:hypothetical protein